MNVTSIAILVGIVAVLAIVFGSKASAPSLLEGLLFLGGFGMVVLVSTDRWINGIDWIVNHSKDLIGMAKTKWEFEETTNALKSGNIDRTTAGTITATCVGLMVLTRIFTSVIALILGVLCGVIVKVWSKVYDLGLSGII